MAKTSSMKATAKEPRIERSVSLTFIGDWGQANFHRICSWLCQEFCDRAGARSRIGIFNLADSGADSMEAVFNGEADLCIATPAHLLPSALTGEGLFKSRAMPSLRALGVLPQVDRMVFAIDPKFGVRSFEDMRRKRPPLRIATSPDDQFSMIGYVAARYLEAHGVSRETIESWGGSFIDAPRPETSVWRMRDGKVDAVLQEAFMTPWWPDMIKARKAVFLPAEPTALKKLEKQHNWPAVTIPANFYDGQTQPMAALDFSDFVIVVRDDMPEDIAHLLTWCLVETREVIQRQYYHIPPERSPLSYPLVPERMAQPSLPLHPGAARYYDQAGVRASKALARKQGSSKKA